MPLFTKIDGTPHKFFVETSAVRERPRLVRQIVAHGGQIVTSAREADILLAENDTREAIELLDAWGSERRVVLSTRWAWRCIGDNKFLGNEDMDYGGFKLDRDVIKSGLSLDEDGNSEIEELPPSPKPRTKRVRQTPLSDRGSSSYSHGQEAATGPSSLQTPLAKRRKVATPRDDGESNLSPPRSSQRSQNIPMTPSQPPAASQVAAIPALTQPNIQALLTTMSGFSQQTQSPSTVQQPDFSATLQAMMPFFTQALLAQTAQSLASNPLFAAQLATQPSSPQVAVPSSSAPQSTVQQIPESPVSGPRGYRSRLEAEEHSEHSEHSESEESDLTPPPPSPTKRPRRRGRSPVQEATPHRPPPVAPAVHGFFTNQFNQQPMKFFVMAPMKCFNRNHVLNWIRKNGGEIVERMSLADHIILDKPTRESARDFMKMYEQVPAEKIALSPFWVQECDKQQTSVDRAKYILDITSVPGPKKKTTNVKAENSPGKAVEDAQDAECESEEENAHGHTVVAHAQPDGFNSSARSPSPPQNVEALGKKTVFTDQDNDWFLRYVRHKLQQKPDMSKAALMQAVGAKAPHHSAKSWGAHCSRVFELEAIRNEVKAQRSQINSPILQTREPSMESNVEPIIQEMLKVKEEEQTEGIDQLQREGVNPA
ncbi:hypothetical protein M422DRAFT_258853 [Sphaerobolus stellatus SS14]|uniref:BRCT domain-containing protein n=1 Tax=Sphaerobolus stellatus (strain SS14) TaxID=990650 RepID=A0A0C9UUE8_SPHS4|nr:hypothetical protein M422DRAFT_258853 [Sphaerobolus stellatus SS14]